MRAARPGSGCATMTCWLVRIGLSIVAGMDGIKRGDPIVILTGAGISAKSGIATFRDKDGIWAKVDVEDVATPEAFARNPQRVLDFYNARRNLGAGGQAERGAHRPGSAGARAHRPKRRQVVLVTQNVDPLHEMAGTRNLIHMHGEYCKTLCNHLPARHPWSAPPSRSAPPAPPAPSRRGPPRHRVVRRDALRMERIYEELAQARPVRLHRHQRQRLSCRRLRDRRRAATAPTRSELNLEPSEGAAPVPRERTTAPPPRR